MHPPAEVEVLGRHPLLRIESADLLPGRAAHEQKSSHCPRDPPGPLGVPGAVEGYAISQPSRRSIGPRFCATCGKGGEGPGQVLGLAGGEDEPGGDDPGSRVASPAATRCSSAPGPRATSALAKQTRGIPFPGDQVHGPAVAQVLLQREQPRPGMTLAHHRRRVVRRGVVDHPDLGPTCCAYPASEPRQRSSRSLVFQETTATVTASGGWRRVRSAATGRHNTDLDASPDDRKPVPAASLRRLRAGVGIGRGSSARARARCPCPGCRLPPSRPEQPDGADVHRTLRWYWTEHDFARFGLRRRVAIERHNQRRAGAPPGGLPPGRGRLLVDGWDVALADRGEPPPRPPDRRLRPRPLA